MDDFIELIYIMPSQPTEKPKADISIITDYDQRYLGIISRIFKKRMRVNDLNDILDAGGNIAAYWHKGRLVGALVWTWSEDGGEILHIGFKKKLRGKGFGGVLMNYAIYIISTKDDYIGGLPFGVKVGGNAQAFFEKYGFSRMLTQV
ncbi:MAG: GNAT family N-acetyltransferase [Defluviitaleaceae bacterium]|nr:GNAT family N-acetyltransferase [Defluviitaleaceae bacterium]